ncbi:MAG: hypothetical protein R2712_28195 [Vicinamibacterales bacterium]
MSPKDAVNECALFEARTSWERETRSPARSAALGRSGSDAAAPSSSARKAFDDLFKF